MSEIRINTYEALFLFPQSASADLQAALDHIVEIMNRNKADIIALRKWDERRLAYDIKGNKRGVYFLAYFKADARNLDGIDRDCRLSERMLRSLVTRADHVPAEEIASHEGRQQLADEINLRANPPAAAEAAPAEA
jgi:small subunit ribosomal protein S6